MSKEMRKYIDYGEFIPDKIVDTFYDRIKDKIEHDENYEHYVRNLLKINGGKLPTKIENLINGL
jgi:hypothetical protein